MKIALSVTPMTEPLREPLTYQARRDVRTASGREANNDAHWPRWIGLRPSDARHRRQRGSARGQMQKFPTVGKFHGVPSQECRTPISADASTLAHRDYALRDFDPVNVADGSW